MIKYNPHYAHLVNEHLQMSAVRMFRDRPRDRDVAKHLRCVWLNCGDAWGWDYAAFLARLGVNQDS